ncbi:hypothetical protein ACH3VR_01315 [Microbacterium sp. B2969]|uniref:DUF4760 domain-containing protein n=1 Tax=Microbacterium alkaliflavum TaxID=3248839 RepID=A0ABW7Q2F0_9MICO
MACGTVETCLAAIKKSLDQLGAGAPLWLEFANTVLTLVIAGAAVAVAFWVFRFDRSRALAADREKLRLDLRAWHKLLSRSAPAGARGTRERLRSSIEEIADANSYTELLTLMRWAVAMENESYKRVGKNGVDDDIAHNARVIVKRRFRHFIAVWATKPRRGKKFIRAYTNRGWDIVVAEPQTAVESAQSLMPRSQWKSFAEKSRADREHWDHRTNRAPIWKPEKAGQARVASD